MSGSGKVLLKVSKRLLCTTLESPAEGSLLAKDSLPLRRKCRSVDFSRMLSNERGIFDIGGGGRFDLGIQRSFTV
jgi:hypothetical protein